MKLLRQRDVPEEKYANAFVGFGDEHSHFVVELTYSMLLTLLALYFPFYMYFSSLVLGLIMFLLFSSYKIMIV